MTRRLWYFNTDFEFELASPETYRRLPTVARINRRMASALLWLARDGDALLLERPWTVGERALAGRRGVGLVDPDEADAEGERVFTPWGWTPGAARVGRRAGAFVEHPPFDVVARVNSKRFSHEIEREIGVAVPGAAIVATVEELEAWAARERPGAGDKWVVKDLLGVAARERVLGRGPRIDPASALWARRRFETGVELLAEPWLDVVREYGVQMDVFEDGSAEMLGVSDMQTNGAGTTTGFLLGRGVDPGRLRELEATAHHVARRLAEAGYTGPAGVDALEHAGGLRPLLEINARLTMGRVAVALERETKPAEPVLWDPKAACST